MVNIEYKVIESNSKYWNNIVELGIKYDNEFVPPISKRININDYFEQFKNINAFVITAMVDSVVIGCFCGFIEKPQNKESWFQYIVIEKDFRKNNIAQIFFNLGFDILKKNNKYKVKTRTWSTNLRSQKIIKDFGFYEIDIILNDRGEGVHTIIYEKEISI